MTDTLVLKSGLKMPSSFVEVKDEEMEYLEGGSVVVTIILFVLGVVVGCLVGWIVDAIVNRNTGHSVSYWFERGFEYVENALRSAWESIFK